MSRHTSRGPVLLAVLAMVSTLLTTVAASAAPDADLATSGFATVTDGETTTGTFTIDVTDAGGLGVGHPLRVALTLTDDEGSRFDNLEVRGRAQGRSFRGTTDADGVVVLPAADAPLTLTDPTDPLTLEFAAELPLGTTTIAAQLLDGTAPVTRVAGDTRYATAAAVSRATQLDGASTVYVATGEDFIDALSGGAGAARDDAPLLLVEQDNLPDTTAIELLRLSPDRIVVLGGTVPVADDVVDTMRDLTDAVVTRRAGDTRFGTAVAVSSSSWTGGSDTVVLANARAFPDAMSGGSLAARLDAPVLLVEQDTLPEETAAELRRLDPDQVFVMGGPVVVGDAVVDAVRALGVADDVERVAGETRYATALAATIAGNDAPGLPARPRGFLATGENFPDALTAVAAVGATGGELMLAPSCCVSTDDITSTEFEDDWATPTADGPWQVTLLGGTVALGDDVRDAVEDVVEPFGVIEARHIGDEVTVTATVEAAPTASPTSTPTPATPAVDITSPTQGTPTTTTTGADTSVTFTTDVVGAYDVLVRPNGGTTTTEVATGTSVDGSNDVTFTAPATPGTYDVIVEVTSTEEVTGTDTELSALVTAFPTPDVTITDPTTAEPDTVTVGTTTSVTFTTDLGGAFDVLLRGDGEDDGTSVASGTATAGSDTVVTFTAPGPDTYDVIVEVTSPDDVTGTDTQVDALTTTPVPSPVVTITDPTQASPTTVQTSSDVTVSFTTDIAGAYELRFRESGTAVTGDPATGMADVGTNEVIVTAPAVAGTYDVIVSVESDEARTGTDTQLQALVTTDPPTPEVDITDPTTGDPDTVTTGDETTVTFTTTVAGDYTLTFFRDGGGPSSLPDTDGEADADTPTTITFDADLAPGTYDLVVNVTTDEERSGSDIEEEALVVEADASLPAVDILSPTGDAPAFSSGGKPVDISFDVVLAGAITGSYEIQFAPSGSVDYQAFGGGSGTVTTDGTVTRTVSAPGASPESSTGYDIRVVLTTLGGVADDAELAAIFVSPTFPSGPSGLCRLGSEDPNVPNMTGAGGDPLDPAHCLLPFPSNFHTVPAVVPDPDGDGGLSVNPLRLNFDVESMPRNRSNKPVDPTEWNRNDGFSPGTMVMTVVPDLDLAQTWNGPGADPDAFDPIITTPERSLDPDAPILLVDADTGERHPYLVELDTHPVTIEGGWPRTMIIRPLVHFEEGHRYLVGLRDLRNGAGEIIEAGDAFTFYRDEGATNPFPGDLEFENRRPIVQQIITDLATHTNLDTTTEELFLAWDFTVASDGNLAGRLLTIRDDAFRDPTGDGAVGDELGDPDLGNRVVEGDAPDLSITSVEEESGSKLRTITGELTIPLYLREPQQTDVTIPDFEGCGDVEIPEPIDIEIPSGVICGLEQAIPGARFLYPPGGDYPIRNPVQTTMTAEFVCNIPSTALVDGAANPSRVALYGHGLLGSKRESEGSSTGRMRDDHNQTHCALDWFGFADEDIANVADTLTDYSSFPSVMDRVQQGFLNWQYLGRAVVHPDGLATAEFNGEFPFRADPTDAGSPLLIDNSRVVYEGNSQGGILGGGLLSIAPDVERGVFGVPGTNYSTLLNRSVDWEGNILLDVSDDSPFPSPVPDGLGFSSFYYNAYPDKVDQQVGFGLLQMLWDRGEGNGYAAHTTTDPYPNTPTHQVLLHPAWGDYQVANLAAEVQARTYDAAILEHSLEDGLHWADGQMTFGFPRLEDAPDHHSALVYWDSGNPMPPNPNLPPVDRDEDPHSDPRKDPDSGIQRDAFFDTGVITDVLPGAPYHTQNYPSRACEPGPPLVRDCPPEG